MGKVPGAGGNPGGAGLCLPGKRYDGAEAGGIPGIVFGKTRENSDWILRDGRNVCRGH